MVLLLEDHLSEMAPFHKVFFNFLCVRWLLFTKFQFGTEFLDGMVILIHRFEILNADVVPLMSGLQKNNSLLLLIPLLQSKLESPWVLFHQIFSFEICMDVVPYYI